MTRALAVILALVLALLGWQSWRLNNADHTIGTQAEALKNNKQELAKKNSQLISLSILTEPTAGRRCNFMLQRRRLPRCCGAASAGSRS